MEDVQAAVVQGVAGVAREATTAEAMTLGEMARVGGAAANAVVVRAEMERPVVPRATVAAGLAKGSAVVAR